ncbi:MAG: tetratricopeptide repeat protein [Bacteroidia bacterium]|nr:tetratricopeptide repeat protein [Bacteroidia bacterium]
MKTLGYPFKTLFFIALYLVCIAAGAMAQQTAGQRFEKALYLEEVNGKLQQAIDQYQLILKEYPANREIIAKTQLHLGICYEKLGLNQARENYQAVINQFPEQLSEVNIAKERLFRLDSFTSGTTLKAEQTFRQAGELFRELKYESAAAEYEKVIQLVPKSRLAEEAQLWIGQCFFKGKKYDQAVISFNAIIREFPQSTIVPVAELMISQAKLSMADEPKKSTVITLDNKTILDTATGIRYTKINTWTGKYDVIKSAASITDIAPNRKFLLADNKVIPFDNGEPFDLIDSLSSVWTNSIRLSLDATRIAFFTENALSVIPVSPETGHPVGPTEKLKENPLISYYNSRLNWSPDGTNLVFSLIKETYWGNLWTLSTEDASFKQVTQLHGSVYYPVFSKDGLNILYTYWPDAEGDFSIWMSSLINGKSETIPDSCLVNRGGRFILSPDNHWILYNQTYRNKYLFSLDDHQKLELRTPEEVGDFVSWADEGNKVFFYRTSFEAQNLIKVASVYGGPVFECGGQTGQYHLGWFPDSKGLIVLTKEEDGKRSLQMISLADLDSKTIMGIGNPGDFPLLSPDCSRILAGLSFPGKPRDLSVLPFSLKDGKVTGKPILIFKGFNGFAPDCDWSPDGKKIAVCHGGEVWICDAEGGTPLQLTRTPEEEKFPKWSPDGKNITVYFWSAKANKSRTIRASDGEIIRNLEQNFIWTPTDGTETAIASSNGQLLSVSLATGLTRIIANSNEICQNIIDLKCSPDGKWIAINGFDTTGIVIDRHIYLISVADGKVTKVATDETEIKYFMAWSPDSKWITFSSQGPKKTRLEGILWEADLTDFMNKIKPGK